MSLEPPPAHIPADVHGGQAPQLASSLECRLEGFFIEGGNGKGAGVMENPRSLHLSPIEIPSGEEGAHAAQVEKSALAACLHQDNRRGGLGAGECDQARVVNAFGADPVANKLAKAVIADGGGNADRNPQARQCDRGVDAIAAGGECDVLKRLARPRWRKMIHRPGQNIGHRVAYAIDFTESYHSYSIAASYRAVRSIARCVLTNPCSKPPPQPWPGG